MEEINKHERFQIEEQIIFLKNFDYRHLFKIINNLSENTISKNIENRYFLYSNNKFYELIRF